MPRPRDVNHVQVILLDQPVQMHPRKRLPRVRTPVPQQPVLDVLRLQRLPQQRILPQIKHARAQIVAGPPVRIHLPQFFGRKSLAAGLLLTAMHSPCLLLYTCCRVSTAKQSARPT